MLLLQFQQTTFFLFLITPSCWIITIEAISKTGYRNRKSEGDYIAAGSNFGHNFNASKVSTTRKHDIAISSSSESSFAYGSSSLPRPRASSSFYPVGPIDTISFCSRKREMKLVCYCAPDEEIASVYKAECWIFVDTLTASDSAWTRFWQQKRIRELKIVIQKHGYLDYLPTFVFDALRNITYFSVEYGNIECVKVSAFSNLVFLERVYLGNNMIINIEEHAFFNLLRLTEINIEYNQVNNINPHAFYNLPAMEKLVLSNNNITLLHDSMFSHMPSLQKLDLSNNHITSFGSDAFKGLGNLQMLSLSLNLLTQVADTVFIELWSLNTLDLSDNNMQGISVRALDGLNNLKTLNLRGNQLKNLDHGVFRGTPALRSVNLEANKIDALPAAPLQPIIENIANTTDGALYLTENNFICDCRMIWLMHMYNRTLNQQPREMIERLLCTLQNPKVEQFVLPIPRKILYMLNVTTHHNKMSLSDDDMPMNKQPLQRQNERKNRQRIEKNLQVAMKKKRNIPVYDPQPLIGLDNIDYIDNAAEDNLKLIGDPLLPDYSEERNLFNNPAIRNYQYKDNVEGEMVTSNSIDDSTNSTKTNANSTIEVEPKPFGIIVRIMSLKPEALHCPPEYVDPTEYPYSRDLMDSRNSSNSTASAIFCSTIKATSFMFAFAISAMELNILMV